MGKQKYHGDHKGLGDLFSKYRYVAKDKNLAWDLSFEDFRALTQSLCVYCGSPPRGTIKGRKYVYNGIDRKDNSLGYIKTNCLSCCKRCNYLKGANLSYEETMLVIAVITAVKKLKNRI